METSSALFSDFLGIDFAFDNGRKAPTFDQSCPRFAEGVVRRELPSPSPSKMKMSHGLAGWDGATKNATEAAQTDMIQTQQMFVHPDGLYAEENVDTIMTLRDRGGQAASRTPELTRPTRLSTSGRATSSLKSEGSGSSSSLMSAATAITPPDPEPPRKRTRSTKKIKKEPLEDHKRNKFLERNRIAASKCREKKKQFVSELEETKGSLEQRHAHLQVEYNALITEVGTLKHELMGHAKCNDSNIDSWIANEARKFVQTSDLFGHQRAAAVTAAAQGQTENLFRTHTRHSSAASSVHHGLGGFSSVGDRRDSMAYSQGTSFHHGPTEDAVVDTVLTASSGQPSPTDMVFPTLPSPKFGRSTGGMNFDHMPDDLFDTEQ